MLDIDFYELFRPTATGDAGQLVATGGNGKKSPEKTAKGPKGKHQKKQSMSEIRDMASGILRKMLDKKCWPPTVSPLLTDLPLKCNESPIIDIKTSASEFAVFAAIRQEVIRKQLKHSALVYSSTIGRNLGTDNDSEEDVNDNKQKDVLMKVPKVVTLGLSVAFELIRESRQCLPTLCIRALQALLNALQGQQPEALKNEPSDVINPLFDLLLDLSSIETTYHDTTGTTASSSTSVSNNQTFVELRSYACSALLSLVTARGDTDKTLKAITALLTTPHLGGDSDIIETPNILISLQRSVHCVLLGKTRLPDWLSHGFSANSLCDTFNVGIPQQTSKHFKESSLAFDGKYLYLYSGNQIHKVGSGYCGTVKGQLVHSNSIGTHKSQSGLIGWIGYIGNSLYMQTNNWTNNELIRLDKNTLKELGKVALGVSQLGPSACASDSESLILITATKDDCFAIRTLKPSLDMTSNLMNITQEITIKLSHKCLSTCGGIGSAIFDQPVVANEPQVNQQMLRPIESIDCEDIVQICCGKDFSLIRTLSGKVFFMGKAQSLGIKQSAATFGKWTELPISKSPKISHISVGHEGSHALLVSDDGSVYFVGLAKRGEDGEQTKSRRQPKAGKPKKILKMEGKSIDYSACNHGSSAMVTKNGELYLFGKDAHYVDRNTGLVTPLKNVFISQVAIGKAHILALSTKGTVYTFGISNKGQCGLDLMQTSSTNKEVLCEDVDERINDQQIDVTEDITEPLCALGQHRWRYDQCMICTLCGECTGYGTACIASGKSERNPGMSCGCGAGDAGCIDCGCCRACEAVSRESFGANENNESPLMPLNEMAFNAAHLNYELQPLRDEVQKFAAAFAMIDPGINEAMPGAYMPANEPVYDEPHLNRAAFRAAINPRSERRKIAIDVLGRRFRHTVKVFKKGVPVGGRGQEVMGEQSEAPHLDVIDKHVSNIISLDMSDAGSDGEASKLTQLPPTKLNLPNRVIQIACGLHHSVLLTSSGDVLTFGSNQYGQLGHNDFIIREVPTKIFIKSNIIQIAAGSNHTVLLSSTGQVYTFGNNQKGQLGRNPSNEYGWNAMPGTIPNIGQQFGRRATYITASGDHTFIKYDESLINPLSLSSSRVIANRRCIAIIPSSAEMMASTKDNRYERQFNSLVINRLDGTCKTFSSSDQLELFNFSAVCLDNYYDVLWTYDSKNHSFNRYNLIYSETKIPNQSQSMTAILLPELALPQKASTLIDRSTAALNLLCTLDTLTTAHQLGCTIEEVDQSKNKVCKPLTKDDYSSVCRFESHGGGWGFSSHSIEAIRFMADTDILLGGFGLFGGRGEYTAKLKLFDIGPDGGEQEGDGEILTETDEISFECAARQKYPILFEEPLPLQANKWYVAWARISGPSSDCGSSGQSVVNTEDQVVFYFKSSKKSNNGTDVNAGQIPQLLYKVMSTGIESSSRFSNRNETNDLYEESICIVSKDFSLTVKTECFQSLLKLLRWSWKSFKSIVCDMSRTGSTEYSDSMGDNVIQLKHLTYICCSALHLLNVYINEIYPNRHNPGKSITQMNDWLRLAECIYEVRTQLKHILSSPPEPPPRNHSFTGEVNAFVSQIMDESHETFLSCYHSFYPNGSLRWRALCDLLLNDDNRLSQKFCSYLLSAMLAALCRPCVRLTQTFPIMNGLDVYNLQSPSELQSPISDLGISYENSVLNEKIQEKTDEEGCHSGTECSFRDIFNNLLKIIGQPIRYSLQQESNTLDMDLESEIESDNSYTQLVENSCNLIITIMSELVAQVTGIGFDSHVMSGQQLHLTPSRFSRISQNRTWNTGNGSPDAICFSVDRAGISIAGITVYGGIGNEWHYELELLDYNGVAVHDDKSLSRDGQSHSWRTIELVKGTYSFEDKSSDVCEMKFDRSVLIAPNVKYAIRLKNHGPRTNNGDAGLTHIRGVDGTTFTFSDCSLSFNGTNHTRGQIPQILYYSTPQSSKSDSKHFVINEEIPRKNAIAITESVISLTVDLLLQAQECPSVDLIWKISSSLLIKKLLPSLLNYLSPVVSTDTKSAIQILSTIRQLVPLVVFLNKSNDFCAINQSSPLPPSSPPITTSRHYVTVESDHPYKSATVCNYLVKFAPTVKWMCIEFDSRCATAQPEDILQMYIPEYRLTKCWESSKTTKYYDNNKSLWPVLKKFSGKSSNWPTNSVVIPGNEMIFSLETASDYVKEDKSLYYGFRAQVIGYENPLTEGLYLGLQYLEQELTYLSGICIKTLLKKNLIFPQNPIESEVKYESILQTFEAHSSLLSKGLALSRTMTATEAIDDVIPVANEHPFLKDFICLTPGTSGARLAKWFQSESFVDPNQCEVHCSCGTDQELQCGWPTVITVITRDQYGHIVSVPNLKVEVSAQPFKNNSETESNTESATDLSNGPPVQSVNYSITVKDKVFYHAITMMRQFENYSFEELRYVTPVKRPIIETMLVRSNNDGTYTANWSPASSGWYQLKITVDGVNVNTTQSVHVGKPPKGATLPQTDQLSDKLNKKFMPSRTRKFVVRNSSGLRVRSLPSLQAEQIGLIEVNGIITINDELHNDDGVWVRLSSESVQKYCNTSTADHNIEGWSLQYNQHLAKTLLVPIGEPKPIVANGGSSLSDIQNTRKLSIDLISKKRKKKSREATNKRIDYPGYYHVVKCGVSGHNIRSSPYLRAPPIGMVVLGNVVGVIAHTCNSSGTWLRLDEESLRRFCFNTDGEGWTLARTVNDVTYLQHESEVMHITDEEDYEYKGYHYLGHKSTDTNVKSITSSYQPPPPYVSPSNEDRSSPTNACSLSQSQHIDKSLSSLKDQTSISQSLATESEVESIPVDSSINSPSILSNTVSDGMESYIESMKTSISSGISSTGTRVAAIQKKFLTDSQSSTTVSPKRVASESPIREPPPELQGINVKELVRAISCDKSPTPPSSPLRRTPISSRSSSPNVSVRANRRHTTTAVLTKSGESNLQTYPIDIREKSCAQKATQTSPPPNEGLLIPPHFLQFKINDEIHVSHNKQTNNPMKDQSLPTTSTKSTNPFKNSINSRELKLKKEKIHLNGIGLDDQQHHHHQQQQQQQNYQQNGHQSTAKEAISNSVAECLRSVFAAFIWHEGILHDTLAAASYLKFNPEVTKETVKSMENNISFDSPIRLRSHNRSDSKGGVSREQKARFRHSVEVSQLSALQYNECYLNANIESNKNKIISETDLSQQEVNDSYESNISCEQLMTQSEESANDKPMIPETLVNLLKLWDIVSKGCLNVISKPPSTMTPSNPTAPTTPVQMFNRIQNNQRVVQLVSDEISKSRNKTRQQYNDFIANFAPKGYPMVRFMGAVAQQGNLFGEAAAMMANGGPNFDGHDQNHTSMCELCGKSYSYPVTHHMRKSHPGCGEHAGGKGYNSSGSYCGGWAGHCGDGGIGSSNWYLICDKCREKYVSQKRHHNSKAEQSSKSSKLLAAELKELPLSSPSKANISSPTIHIESHQIMRENSMFLLRMSANNDVSPMTNVLMANRKRQSLEFGVQSSGFQCLENLGIHHSIYDQRLAEEHLSEDDIIAIQSGRESNLIANSDLLTANDDLQEMTSKGENKSTANNSRHNFCRSVSVGIHDWNQEKAVSSTASPRKRAVSNENSCTTFLCQPSANLINLVHLCFTDNQSSTLDTNSIDANVMAVLSRPIMAFILQTHDLNGLMIAMRSALRKSSCRTLGLQALNWLLRNVSQPVAIHDLMWFFIDALTTNDTIHKVQNKEETEENIANGDAVGDNAINAANNRISVEKRNESEVSQHKSQTDVCHHPLADLTIAGEATQVLRQAFHSFLSTVSELMPLLPMGSPLQQIAVRCFCLQFNGEDHSFLHQCHVFSNISKIFGRNDEEQSPTILDESHQSMFIHPALESYQDLTSQMEIKASSRQAMIASLNDNSTETFWESGDEDRNKAKVITIINNNDLMDVAIKSIYIHIDNVRDLGAKISQVSFKSGDSNASEPQMIKLKVTEVDNRFAGWLYCVIPYMESRLKCIRIELKGPDNTLRLRQIKILGASVDISQERLKPPISYIQIQQTNCETETLKVFRLLTSQVFGKLITGEADSDSAKNESNIGSGEQIAENGINGAANDLREHMVGILFSQSGKLTHLQKQVCAHIVQAIRVEAIRQREEWETLLCSKSMSVSIGGEIPSDAYCFEMLSMVLALSGSTVGRQYLAIQNDLLLDLFCLLHTASARVQRQVIALLRRVLPEIKPTDFGKMFGVSSLPPRDIIISNDKNDFDIHSVGILDVFLACIAKALTVQTKFKGSVGGANSKSVTTITLATAIHPRDLLGDRWWLRGCLSRKLSECIITLLKDMSGGKLSEAWAVVTKSAIAQNILNLTLINERLRAPTECIKTPTLWLALASLCVLDEEQAERLSSSHWVTTGDQENGNQQSRPFCDNHDDGETAAIILCNSCGNLCAECDRYLHLHSKTRCHQRQIFKEEEEAIRVDLHEGCGRTKLFWAMALADSKTLKAMVEFKGDSTRTKSLSTLSNEKSMSTPITGVCRFCGTTSNTGLLAIGNVCGEAECQEYAKNACSKMLSCGHQCGGVANEVKCLPCLQGCGARLKQDGDDMCMICFCEALSCAPAIQLNCGHLFHSHCTKAVLENGWSGPRIIFSFSLCPICKSPIDHPSLEDLLAPIRVLYDDVRRKALMRLEYEGLHRCEAITVSGGRFYKDAASYAMERYAYYVCHKCKKAYYGGEARCDAELGVGDNYDPTELVCGGCSDVSRAQMCPKHGTDFLEYKCRYCCSVAVFFCFGTTHFCNQCHDDFQKLTNLREFPKCPAGPRGKQLEGDECPLHVKHPPTGEEFALGCGVCRNAHTF